MKFSLSILSIAIAIASVTAYPTIGRRQQVCSFDQLSGLTVVAQAEGSGKTRWDVFTESSGAISQGDVTWFVNDQPNDNEIFTATAGSAPGLFTFQRRSAQQIGIDGSTLLASNTPMTFLVTCAKCDDLASGNDLAAESCTMEATDGTNGNGQCVTFTGSPATVITTACNSGNDQLVNFFSTN